MIAISPLRKLAPCLLMLAAMPGLGGCAIGYYWQAGAGHLKIVNGQQPVVTVLRDPDLEPSVRARLQVSQRALAFAHDTLRLPDNGSYTGYYDTGEPYAVWNVFAAPELSLKPRTWCFPVAGCISYRGYFSERSARRYADQLAARGDDVFVGGITAYSTLGRFRDPVLNTMLAQPEQDLIGLLFHELAHQRLYVQDDSAFNEAFATAVEMEGLRRWRIENSQLVSVDDNGQRTAVQRLLRDGRRQLSAVYASDRDPDAKRRAKQEVLADLAASYDALLVEWRLAGLKQQPYAHLFRQGLNNASLAALATYDDYVPAFGELLRQCGAWLACFYVRAETLAAMARPERTARLQELVRIAAGRKK